MAIDKQNETRKTCIYWTESFSRISYSEVIADITEVYYTEGLNNSLTLAEENVCFSLKLSEQISNIV